MIKLELEPSITNPMGDDVKTDVPVINSRTLDAPTINYKLMVENLKFIETEQPVD